MSIAKGLPIKRVHGSVLFCEGKMYIDGRPAAFYSFECINAPVISLGGDFMYAIPFGKECKLVSYA